MSMTFDGFSKTNRRRCESPDGFNHSLASWSRADWLTATLGELGEAANVAKKLKRIADGVPGNPLVRVCPVCGTSWRHDHVRVEKCSCGCEIGDVKPTPDPALAAELRDQLRDEIADTFIYLDLLAQSQGIDLGEAVRNKFNRTSDKLGCDIKL